MTKSKAPQLVVMAAGVGSRYGGLKQVDPVGPGGEILLDYAIYDAIRAGFGKVVFVIRKDIEDTFREKVGRTVEKRIDTAYVFQELDRLPDGFTVAADRVKPWGTAHAVLCAKEAVTGPCAVINADDFYGAGSYKVLHDHLKDADDTGGAYDYSMVGFVLGNTLSEHGYVSRGVCTIAEGGFLAGIIERTKIKRFDDAVRYCHGSDEWIEIDADSTVSLNMWGFTPSIFSELQRRFSTFLKTNINDPKAEFFVPTVVNELIQERKARVQVLHTDERWFGVTYQQDRPHLKKVIQERIEQGVYPAKLWV